MPDQQLAWNAAGVQVLQQKMQEISTWRRQHNEVIVERDTLSRMSSRLTRENQRVQEQVRQL